MATNPKAVSSGTAGEKAIALVRKIIDRSRQGRLNWQRVPSGLRATIAGKLDLFFSTLDVNPIEVLVSSMPTRAWSVFLVRDEAGKEILKVIPQSNPFLSMLSGPEPLIREVDTLFNLVSETATNELDKAINLLDQI